MIEPLELMNFNIKQTGNSVTAYAYPLQRDGRTIWLVYPEFLRPYSRKDFKVWVKKCFQKATKKLADLLDIPIEEATAMNAFAESLHFNKQGDVIEKEQLEPPWFMWGSE